MSARETSRAIGVIGDVNYLEYDGMVVYDDGSADLVLAGATGDDQSITVYRFDLDQIARVKKEWFGKNLAAVAQTVGRPQADLKAALASDNLMLRASAYYDLIGYYGPDEFDQYPLRITLAQAEKRYAQVDKELGELKPNPLLSARDTTKVEKLVRRAAAVKFGRGKARPFFEHGQWFVEVGNRTYSVADYRPGLDGTGLDFEELG